MASLYPSLIAADPLNLGATLKNLDSCVDGYHIDVMDDHFVPNLTWGPAMVNAIAAATDRQIWVHLMVDNPAAWPDRLELPARSIVTIHFESTKEIKTVLQRIKEKNWLAGLAISPKTAPQETFELLPSVDQLLIMSVEPGFSGQQFMQETTNKIKPLLDFRTAHALKFSLAMDGGITKKNIAELAAGGVDTFAVASAVFAHNDLVAAIVELKNISQQE